MKAFKKHFNKYLSHLFETGLYGKFEDDSFREAVANGLLRFYTSELDEQVALDPQYFVMPAMILIMGYILSLLSFVVEKLLHYYGLKNLRQNSYIATGDSPVV